MDFPLDFKICFQPWTFNETALKSFGYKDIYLYVNGAIQMNDSHVLIGWGGNQSIRAQNASEVLRAAKTDWTTSQVLEEFQIWPEPGSQNVTLQRINWISDCYMLNIFNTKNGYRGGMKSVVMSFDESKLNKHNVSIELKLQGHNLAANRNIQNDVFYHTGDLMKLDKMTEYRVKIKKRVFFEGEPGNTCRNYPNTTSS